MWVVGAIILALVIWGLWTSMASASAGELGTGEGPTGTRVVPVTPVLVYEADS